MPNLNAYYDVDTDTIHNCQKYSYAWCHERIHQLQMHSKVFKAMYVIHNFMVKAQTHIGVFICSLISTASFLYILGLIPADSLIGSMAIGGLLIYIVYYPLLLLETDALLRGTLLWWQKRKARKMLNN
jgi:hypothetical protein